MSGEEASDIDLRGIGESLLIVGHIHPKNTMRLCINGQDSVLRHPIHDGIRAGLADTCDPGDSGERPAAEFPALSPPCLAHYQLPPIPDGEPGDRTGGQVLCCRETSPTLEAINPKPGKIEVVRRKRSSPPSTLGRPDPNLQSKLFERQSEVFGRMKKERFGDPDPCLLPNLVRLVFIYAVFYGIRCGHKELHPQLLYLILDMGDRPHLKIVLQMQKIRPGPS